MNEQNGTYNPSAAYEAQKKYCEENNKPFFISGMVVCPQCGVPLFYPPFGYTVEEAASGLITGCPNGHSFLD